MGKTHWRKIIESDYLSGADLDDGKGKTVDIDVTIRRAAQERVKDVNGKDETCLVLRFEGDLKPMICNVTNAKTISKLVGSTYIEDWAGKRITIGTERVRAFGELWNALRVRKVPPKAATPNAAPTCADCKQTVPEYQGVAGAVIAERYEQMYGAPLCYACGQKRKEGADAGNAQ